MGFLDGGVGSEGNAVFFWVSSHRMASLIAHFIVLHFWPAKVNGARNTVTTRWLRCNNCVFSLVLNLGPCRREGCNSAARSVKRISLSCVFRSKPQIWLNIVALLFLCLFPLLFSFALKLGQADPSHGNSFQTELPERLLCHERSQYRCHAKKKKKKLIEKRLTCFKARWELGARRKPKVLELR